MSASKYSQEFRENQLDKYWFTVNQLLKWAENLAFRIGEYGTGFAL